jgi:hypothetical protein
VSEQHARTLQKLRREVGAAIEAAQAALDGRVWGPLEYGSAEFERVVANAERTYYVRLCAEVEAMIYVHLGDHFRFDGLPADEQVRERVAADDLLEAVGFRVRFGTDRQISTPKFVASRAVYAYRNRLAHGNRSRQAPVSLEQAFDDLESLLLELPNMKTD